MTRMATGHSCFGERKATLEPNGWLRQLTKRILLTIDRWSSLADFTVFLDRFGREYDSLDEQFQEFAVAEAKIGTFVTPDMTGR